MQILIKILEKHKYEKQNLASRINKYLNVSSKSE